MPPRFRLIAKLMTNVKGISDVHVLVVDDEDFMRSMIRRLLGVIGVGDISEAGDGADALSKLADVDPDIVILDIMMEPMNGLKLLKAVRVGMSDAPADLPVIVLTGSADEAVLGTAMALDCDAFVRKNEEPDVIRQRIERTLATPREIREPEFYHGVRIPDISIRVSAPSRAGDAGLPPAQARQVSVSEMEIGDVLARDIVTADGHLLLANGTEITTSYLNRLRDISEFVDFPDLWIRQQ